MSASFVASIYITTWPMKNILIPCDFSLSSLDCMEALVHKFKFERINITFIHVFLLSDSITDLMLLSRRRKEDSYISDEFWNQCKQLEKRYWHQVNTIKVACFYGNTVAVFKNYLESHHINLIVYPQNYQFRMLCKGSFDPARLIARSGREVLRLTEDIKRKEAKSFQWVKNMSYQLSPN